MIYESIKMVLKVFKTNKMRTFLTMLGIIIGIFSITMIFSISAATQKAMYSELEDLDTSVIMLSIWGTITEDGEQIIPISKNEILQLKETSEHIEKVAVAKEFTFQEIEEKQQDNEGVIVHEQDEFLAVSRDFFAIKPKIAQRLVDGRLFTKMDEDNRMPFCIIREDFAEDLLGTTENLVGKTIIVNKNELEIIGVMRKEENEGYTNMTSKLYVLDSYASDFFTESRGQNAEYLFTPTDNQERAAAVADIHRLLEEYLKRNEEYYIQEDSTSYLQEVGVIFDIMELIFAGIAGLSLLVGGIGIMNIMLVSVNERIKEIGIRMALGAKQINIMVQFLIEGVMLTIFSGILGMALAYGVMQIANFVITNQMDFELELTMDLAILVKTILFCGGVGVLFGIYPAWKASKLNPIDALHYE